MPSTAERTPAGTGRFRHRLAPILLLAVLLPLCAPRTAAGQDVLWIGRIGTDTAVVETAHREGSRITGIIVNVAAGLLVQRYEVDLDPKGGVRSLRSWPIRDLASGEPSEKEPTFSVTFASDSIRYTRAGPRGPRVGAVPAVEGAVPLFDEFFDNPMALMDIALRQAEERGDGRLPLFYVGYPAVSELALEHTDATHVAFPYVLAKRYPMMAGARLRATVTREGMAAFDAGETTFKIVTERGTWTDAMALARSFKERGVGAGGFSNMSPATRATGSVGSASVQVDYGAPSKRGRRIFPDVVPFGEVWRAGANAATRLTISADLTIAGQPVPAGSYSLWVLPGRQADTLIINKADRIWGTQYDPEQDLVRVPLRREMTQATVDKLVYTISAAPGGHATLTLSWDDRRMSVDLAPGTGGGDRPDGAAPRSSGIGPATGRRE